MLRVTTVQDDARGCSLKLEGRLVGRWVGLLQRIWERYRLEEEKPLTLDVSGIRFASRAGALLLCRLQSEGVVCTGWPPYLRAVCEDEDSPEGEGTMPRIEAMDASNATGKSKVLLAEVRTRFGMTPNIHRTLAHSPAALGGYLALGGALAEGALDAKLREQIALVVAEANGCSYCLAAHSAVGRVVGLSDDALREARRASSSDPGVDAVLKFARRLVDERGHVSDRELEEVRSAGYGEGEIAEIVAHVALNIFTNYFNHVAGTEVDFPRVAALSTVTA